MAIAAGCSQNSNLAHQQRLTWQQQQQRVQQQYLAQLQETQRRAGSLDVDNRDLHATIAQSQQDAKRLNDELALMRKRLGETAQQLAQTREAKEEADKQIAALQASTRHRGGATITANNGNELSAIELPGINVRQDVDVVRIELPADSLFLPNTATLHRGAFPLIQKVADAVNRSYPRQIIGVEGHMDNRALANDHHLSASQALAVLQQLTTRYRVDSRRLFVLGRGSGHPLVSNGTPAGQRRNRRVEIVVYPETIQ